MAQTAGQAAFRDENWIRRNKSGKPTRSVPTRDLSSQVDDIDAKLDANTCRLIHFALAGKLEKYAKRGYIVAEQKALKTNDCIKLKLIGQRSTDL